MENYICLYFVLPQFISIESKLLIDDILLYMGLHPLTLIISCMAVVLSNEFASMTARAVESFSRWQHPYEHTRGISGLFADLHRVMDSQYWSIRGEVPSPLTRCIYAPFGLDCEGAVVTAVDWITGDQLRIRMSSRVMPHSTVFTIWQRKLCIPLPNDAGPHFVFEPSAVWPPEIEQVAALCEAREPIRALEGVDIVPPHLRQQQQQ